MVQANWQDGHRLRLTRQPSFFCRCLVRECFRAGLPKQTMPENLLTDAVRSRLEPESEPANVAPQLPTCCTLRPDVALELLTDLRACLPERTKEGRRIIRIATSSVMQLLQTATGSPWRGLSPHKLARMLGSFDVHPCAIRFRNGVFRGYEYDELQSAFLTRLAPAQRSDNLTRA